MDEIAKRSEPQTGDTPVDAAVETTLVETAERKAGSAVGAITPDRWISDAR